MKCSLYGASAREVKMTVKHIFRFSEYLNLTKKLICFPLGVQSYDRRFEKEIVSEVSVGYFLLKQFSLI